MGGNFRRLIIGFCLSIAISFLFPPYFLSVHAQTTLQSTAAVELMQAGLAGEITTYAATDAALQSAASGSAAATQAAASEASQVVDAEIISTPPSTTGTTASPTVVQLPNTVGQGVAVLSSSAAEGALFGLGQSAALELASLAKSRYCASNPASTYCGTSGSYGYQVGQTSKNYPNLNCGDPGWIDGQPAGLSVSFTALNIYLGSTVVLVNGDPDGNPWTSAVICATRTDSAPVPASSFNQWSPAAQASAIGSLSSADVAPLLSSQSIPYTPGSTITGNGVTLVDGSGNSLPLPYTIPGAIPTPTSTPTSTGSGSGTGTGSGSGSGTGTGTGSGSGSGTGTGTGSGSGSGTSPSASPGSPNPSPTTMDQCAASGCQSQLTRPNFITYATGKFSAVFPFDILGDTSWITSSSVCPTFTLWGASKDLCPLSTVVTYIKYPVWVTYIVGALKRL